ncbi:hypothetical protein PIB30_010300 [Stylosanthes scabra]|uniref:Uncharacterized protein n=1 Tax=Stylosanthes scabra TaxID=79078 RepID=A0ABU6U5M7_9FABA|nr:hypothetical protein [Stylosanthes scabra]
MGEVGAGFSHVAPAAGEKGAAFQVPSLSRRERVGGRRGRWASRPWRRRDGEADKYKVEDAKLHEKANAMNALELYVYKMEKDLSFALWRRRRFILQLIRLEICLMVIASS